MNKYRYRYGVIILALTASCMLGACTQEDSPAATKPGALTLRLQLGLPVEMEVATRTTETTIGVEDVWIVQFIAAVEGAASKMIAKHYENTTDKNDVITWVDNDGKYNVTTGSDFTNTNSEFYVIANAGSTHAVLSILEEGSPLSALKACTKKIKDDALVPDDIVNEPGILVAGPVQYEAKASSDKVYISAHLQRAYAKVTVKWDVKPENFTGATFTATSLTVKNLPRTISFFERAGATSGAYPAESDIYTGEITPTLIGTDSVSFYMAENLRGMGISGTAQGKNLPGNGPESASGSRSLAGCTCITLSGDYKYDSNHTGAVGVKYSFYLGGDLTSDYNIRRGRAYALKITVSGVNSADLRVTITNGNVAVFDQVTEIGEIGVEI